MGVYNLVGLSTRKDQRECCHEVVYMTFTMPENKIAIDFSKVDKVEQDT